MTAAEDRSRKTFDTQPKLNRLRGMCSGYFGKVAASANRRRSLLCSCSVSW